MFFAMFGTLLAENQTYHSLSISHKQAFCGCHQTKVLSSVRNKRFRGATQERRNQFHTHTHTRVYTHTLSLSRSLQKNSKTTWPVGKWYLRWPQIIWKEMSSWSGSLVIEEAAIYICDRHRSFVSLARNCLARLALSCEQYSLHVHIKNSRSFPLFGLCCGSSRRVAFYAFCSWSIVRKTHQADFWVSLVFWAHERIILDSRFITKLSKRCCLIKQRKHQLQGNQSKLPHESLRSQAWRSQGWK